MSGDTTMATADAVLSTLRKRLHSYHRAVSGQVKTRTRGLVVM